MERRSVLGAIAALLAQGTKAGQGLEAHDPTPEDGTVLEWESSTRSANASLHAGAVNVRDHGAVGDGVTNDRAAFAAADVAAERVNSSIYVPPGTYVMRSSITIRSPIIVAAGGALSPAASVRVTILGAMEAPPVRIFDGNGNITFGTRSTPEVLLNWFAKGDAMTATGCAMTAATNELRRAGGTPFTAADVGKRVTIPGAGMAGANLNTTIASFASGTLVRTAATARTTVSGKTIVFATHGQAEIQKAVNAVQGGAGTLVALLGSFMVESTLTIESHGMAFEFAKPGAQLMGIVDAGSYALHLKNCKFVHVRRLSMTCYSGNAIKVGDPSGDSYLNSIIQPDITGPGRGAGKPAVGTGSFGLRFAGSLSTNYFNWVERPFVEQFDTLIYIDGAGTSNAQIIEDPHVEQYWYAIVIAAQECEVRGGFAHDSAGVGADRTEVFRLRSTAAWNKISGMMAEPSGRADALGFVIEAGAHNNELTFRNNVAGGNIDDSTGLNTNTEPGTGRGFSFAALKDDKYYRISQISLAADYASAIVRLRWSGKNTSGGSRNAGSAIYAVHRGSGPASITASCLHCAQANAGDGIPVFKGFERSAEILYPIFYVTAIAGPPTASLDLLLEVSGDGSDPLRLSSELRGVPTILGAADQQAANIAKNSSWDSGGIMIGAYHLWIDAAGRLRVKSSKATFDADGTVVGTHA